MISILCTEISSVRVVLGKKTRILAENIFLTRKDVLKLGDFGCSFRLHDTVTRFGEIVNYVGTTHYMAPEIQTNGGILSGTSETSSSGSFEYIGYGRAVDIWSTGCVRLAIRKSISGRARDANGEETLSLPQS